MRLSELLTAVSLISITLAQSPASTSSAASSQATAQIVTVSNQNGTLSYFPENIQAEPGTFVIFEFYPKNHTVTESSFAQPCVPLNSTLQTITRPGVMSGFMPVSADASLRPAFTIMINDTKPIWLYCSQGPHCAKGMAMVINQAANATLTGKTLEKYKANAAALAASGSSSGYGTATTTTTSGYGYGSSVTATSLLGGPTLVTSTFPGTPIATKGANGVGRMAKSLVLAGLAAVLGVPGLL